MSAEERWRWIEGYEGLYMVSDHGRVMGLQKTSHYGHIMKLKKTRSGYMHVCLCKGNVKADYAVHRLVASAFLERGKSKTEVNHKNGVRDDNRVENLEWVTRSENERHAYHILGKTPNKPWKGKPRTCARKFTDEQIRAIRSDTRTHREIGADYGVSKTAIRDIKIKKNYVEVV